MDDMEPNRSDVWRTCHRTRNGRLAVRIEDLHSDHLPGAVCPEQKAILPDLVSAGSDLLAVQSRELHENGGNGEVC